MLITHEIRIYSKASGYADFASLPPRASFGDASWSIEPNAGYSDFSLSIPETEVGEWEGVINHGDRVEIFDRHGLRRYRGYVTDLDLSEGEPPMLAVSGYGRVLDLTSILLKGDYDYPDKVDVSTIFAEIASDVNARHPDIQVESHTIGREVERLGTLRRSARDAFDDLLGFAKSVAHYGYDVSSFGRDRLYLRSIGTEVAHRFPLASVWSGARSSKRSSADVFNTVVIEGGAPDFPQLLPNGSFESLIRAGDGSGNLISNPSFEENTSNDHTEQWSGSSGASWKTSGGDEAQAYDGAWACELDSNGEKVSQTVQYPAVALVVGHDYELSFWARPESFSTDLDNPPKVRGRLVWLNAGGGTISTAEVFTDARYQKWEQYTLTDRCPSNATQFRVELELTDEGLGGTSGVLVDQVSVADATTLVAQGWGFRAFGTAQVKSANWAAKGSFHGRNCLSINVTASDTDGQDIQIRMNPEYRIGVVGGQSIRFSERIKSADGVTLPKHLFEFRWLKADGSEAGHDKVTLTPSSAFSEWSHHYAVREAPADATELEVWITLRGSGSFMLDAVSVRDAADEATDYLEPGNLVLTYSVDEVLNFLDPSDAFNSISVYGIREKAIRVDGITTIIDARNYAREWLLFHAALYDAPSIEIRDYDLPLWVGDLVELTGESGSLYAGKAMPIARINASLDEGVVVYQIELQVAEPTDEELLDAFIEDKIRERSTGASASTGGGTGRGSTVATGAVKSVGLTVLGGFSVSGSPVTGTGTIAISTALSGIVKGTGSGFAAATAGTDYLAPITGATNQTLRFSGTNTLAAATNLVNDGTTVSVVGPLVVGGMALTSQNYGYGTYLTLKSATANQMSALAVIANGTPSDNAYIGQFSSSSDSGVTGGGDLLLWGSNFYKQHVIGGQSNAAHPWAVSIRNGDGFFASHAEAIRIPFASSTTTSADKAIQLYRPLAGAGGTGVEVTMPSSVDGAFKVYAPGFVSCNTSNPWGSITWFVASGAGNFIPQVGGAGEVGFRSGNDKKFWIGDSGNWRSFHDTNGDFATRGNITPGGYITKSSALILQSSGGAYGGTQTEIKSESGCNGTRVYGYGTYVADLQLSYFEDDYIGEDQNINFRIEGRDTYHLSDSGGGEPEVQIGNFPGGGDLSKVLLRMNLARAQFRGSVQPLGGYKAVDGTAGASATTGGAVFKNGLYVSGSITGGSSSAAGSTGQVQFNGGSSAFAGSASLFWDATNTRLGVGTNAPGASFPLEATLHVKKAGAAAIVVEEATAGGYAAFVARGASEGDLILQHTSATSGAQAFYFRVKNGVFDIINLSDNLGSINNYVYSATAAGRVSMGFGSANSTTIPGVLNIGSTGVPNIVVKAVASQSVDLQQWRSSADAVIANVDVTGVAKFAGLKSSDGTAGGTTTTGGLVFKNGLYTSGSASGGAGASGGTGFPLARAAGYQTAFATDTFYPDDGLKDESDTTAYAKTGAVNGTQGVTAVYDLKKTLDQTALAVKTVTVRLGYTQAGSCIVEGSDNGTTWTTPFGSSPLFSFGSGME